MNVNVLIDAIVRQNVVLIAQLATAAGVRAPLAHIANQIFLDLVKELQAQGVGQKIIADMFGLALRTYHAKVRRLSESATERGKSLWEAVLGFIQDQGFILRAEILIHFSRDDAMTVRGVLNDLVETGLVFRTGRGDRTAYRAATPEELGHTEPFDESERAARMTLVAINRYNPATRADILQAVPLDPEDLDASIAYLLAQGQIRTISNTEDNPAYTCDECVIPYGTAVGWEAAVFDHYQAMVTAICMKLQQGRNQALPQDAIGGSTYGFDLWEGHPMYDEVLGLLARVRAQASELRSRVDTHNATHQAPPDSTRRVLFYTGQTLLLDEESAELAS